MVEIKLTCEYANHIMNNYIHFNPPHDLDFLEIQRLMKRAKYTHEGRRIYRGIASHKGKQYFVFIILTSKFAVVKTCFYTQKIWNKVIK